MVKVFTHIQTKTFILEIGKMEKNMDRGLMSLMKLQLDIQEIGTKINWYEENGFSQMETTIKEILKIINQMVEGNGYLRTEMLYKDTTINW